MAGARLPELFSPSSKIDPKEGQEEAAHLPSRTCTRVYPDSYVSLDKGRGNSSELNLRGQLAPAGLVNPVHTGPVKMRDYCSMWSALVCGCTRHVGT